MQMLDADLAALPMHEIFARARGILKIPNKIRQKKALLLEHIRSHAPPDLLSGLRTLGRQKRHAASATAGEPQSQRKRKRKEVEEPTSRRVSRRVEEEWDAVEYDGIPLSEEFMKVPSTAEVHACYRAFYNATSNAALKKAICGVCGREVSIQDGRVTSISLSALPNAQRLVPRIPHPAHDLYDGKLLQPEGVSNKNGTSTVNVCGECMDTLRKGGDGPPKFSLANGLWLGKVPWQLQVLTVPEQMLIALLYPRVFVFKLFPKNAGGGHNADTLQRAMRGNVSTYELNIEGIASMIDGKLMPRAPAILASVISVTFIGLGQLPRQWLHTTFRVRRHAVHDALCWLKENNPKYYGDIEISTQRIQGLPEDSVPDEILQTVRQSMDTGIVLRESDGYVPLDTECDEKGSDSYKAHEQYEHVDDDREDVLPHGNETDEAASEDQPNVIPLQVSGAIDTDLTNLTANELVLWGLSNLWNEGREGGYAICHSRQPAFRDRIVAFIHANLRVHVPGLETKNDIKNTPNETDIAYNRPPHPDAPDYVAKLADFERRLVRSQQLHTCDLRRCLIPDRRGFYRCKRRAPFSVSETDFINENGEWGQKRTYSYLNGWMPAILVNARCNNDAKLLTNGADTKNCTYYICKYTLKPQVQHFNLSALMAKGYAYHLERSSYTDTLRDHQQLLLFRLVHTLNREQEIAAPMVISYLMGWGDSYRSHHYSIVYWSSFVKALYRAFPDLRQSRCAPQSSETGQVLREDAHKESTSESPLSMEADHTAAMESTQHDGDCDNDDGANETVSFDTDSTGRLYPKSQLTDYTLCGDRLEDLNVFWYFVDTYEEDLRKNQIEGPSDSSELTDQHRRPGRHRNERIAYHPDHPCSKTKQRVMRSPGHNNLPNFIGSYFPRNDDPGIADFYCASMLVLLKPWRDLSRDLKAKNESWMDALGRFIECAPKKTRDIMSGIQYFHECRSAASKRDDTQLSAEELNLRTSVERSQATAEEDLLPFDEDTVTDEDTYTEEGLQRLIASQGSIREEFHGCMAVESAKRAKIFSVNEESRG
ncbi:hypothetical protein CERSUDRAFT_72611 [Gelatoporia subvermispora B]|uniref:DUF6570 domain-containing protein n=1 Tax=Ceriporiopsis subvermispora (strain B) TaxID=914234 RepID=M2RGR5_CERS8|nr:hypothetical protein CERSUDRAFT_72611 [Gelatoporia subvermispora B]